jgi:creatinine amidohydrolase
VDLLPTATSTDEQRRGARVAVLPIGSFEQHGTFLPLTTDTIVACAIADAVAERYDVLRLPPITISCSHEHSGFAGTVSISARTLHSVIVDVAASLEAAGVRRLVLVNGHGGNYALGNVVQEANVGERRMTLFPARADWDRARAHAGLETSGHDDMHGGELEVSILLAVAPEMVGEEYRDGDHDAADRPHLLLLGLEGYTKSGIIGRPSLGTEDKGRALLAILAEAFAENLRLLDPHAFPSA